MKALIKNGASVLLAASLAALTLGAHAEGISKLVVGADPSYRPISYTNESGQLVGFDVDFAQALGKHMQVPVDYQGMAWDGIIPGLQANKINAITNLVITDERKQVVSFSTPIMAQTIVAVVRSPDKDKPISLDNLAGHKVGVMVNTAAATALATHPDLQLTTYNSVVDAYNDLLLKRIDVVAVESVNGAYIAAQQFPGKLVVVAKPLTDDIKLNGVALRKDDTAGLAQVNTAIAQMKADGSLAAIATKWFGSTANLPQ